MATTTTTQQRRNNVDYSDNIKASTNTYQVTFKENATEAERNEAKAKARAASVDPNKPLDEYNIGSFKGFGYVPPSPYPLTPLGATDSRLIGKQIVLICLMITYLPSMSTAMLR